MGYGETTKGYRLYDQAGVFQSFLMSKSVDLRGLLKWNHRKECILNIPTKTQKRLETADTSEPVPRRQPNYYGYRYALEKQEWLDAMQTEIDSLHSNGVWKLVELPEGLDYDETFSPVVRSESVRSLSTKNGLKLHQLDITTAFLNGDLQEEVYMKKPEGFLADGQENLVCRLEKRVTKMLEPGTRHQAEDDELHTQQK